MGLERKAVVALGLLASACAVGPIMDDSLKPYIGHQITEFSARFGPPESQQSVGEQRWYTWGYRNLAVGYQGAPLDLQCRVSLMTDATDRILSYRWDGNNGGCLNLARSLR